LISLKCFNACGAIILAMIFPVLEAAAVTLPPPLSDGGHSLEKALRERRSVREFRAQALRLEDIGQLAWAAQGMAARSGQRTAPSAGALYPLELYVAVANVQGLAAGVYRYEPSAHRLDAIAQGDRRRALVAAALGQRWIGEAAAVFVIAGVERRTTAKYGRRGVRYVHMEAGHAAQNLLLQATALRLGATVVGAFSDAAVEDAAALPDAAQPLYLVPVGHAR